MLCIGREIRESEPDKAVVVLTCACGCVATVQLLETKRGEARLGFQAPKSTSINRLEVQRRVDAEATEAKS